MFKLRYAENLSQILRAVDPSEIRCHADLEYARGVMAGCLMTLIAMTGCPQEALEIIRYLLPGKVHRKTIPKSYLKIFEREKLIDIVDF